MKFNTCTFLFLLAFFIGLAAATGTLAGRQSSDLDSIANEVTTAVDELKSQVLVAILGFVGTMEDSWNKLLKVLENDANAISAEAVTGLIDLAEPVVTDMVDAAVPILQVAADSFKVDQNVKSDIIQFAQTVPDLLSLLANAIGLSEPTESMKKIGDAVEQIAEALS